MDGLEKIKKAFFEIWRPSQSLNLSPTENIWRELKMDLHRGIQSKVTKLEVKISVSQ